MKIDMHCHVKEGSIDSKVGLEEYITILKKHGFQGMVITDHDTYNGYRYWKDHIKGKKHSDFVVLKGIVNAQGIFWRCAGCLWRCLLIWCTETEASWDRLIRVGKNI